MTIFKNLTGHKNKIQALIILGLILLGLGLSFGIAPYQLDDAYITYRYAANINEGHGPVFNPGTEPVEGFSSPLWLLLLSTGALILGIPSLPALGMGLGLTSFILCYGAIFYSPRKKRMAYNGGVIAEISDLLPALLLTVFPAAVFYAVTGMESMLFLAALLFFFKAASRDIPLKWGLIAGFLACWIRPEGIWFLPAMAFLLLGRGEPGKIREKSNLLLAGSVILGNVTLIGARILIFKSLLPNTYFAKEPWLKAGWLYLLETMSGDWAIFLLLLALLGIWMGDRRHRGYFMAGLSWLVAVLIEGGDWMPAGRLLLPAFGLFLMASSGIFKNTSLPFPVRKKISANRVIASMVLIILLATVFVNLKASLNIQEKARLSQNHSAFLERVLADWVSKSGAQSIGTADIGIMGFFPRIEMVDFAGLTDKYIGRSPGFHLKKQFDLSYIFEKRKPDIILLRVSRKPQIYPNGRIKSQVKSGVENRIIRHPDFRATYHFLFAILPSHPARPYYGKLVFGRHGFTLKTEAIPPDRVMYVSSK
jgi:hypothetical protein